MESHRLAQIHGEGTETPTHMGGEPKNLQPFFINHHRALGQMEGDLDRDPEKEGLPPSLPWGLRGGHSDVHEF